MSPTLPDLLTLLRGRRVCVLTGAGCSTESGIPDYRGPETARRARNPIQFADFVADPAWRRRYWARSSVGWLRIHQARPNAAHRALSELEAQGRLTGLITQNVDGLHQSAGSRHIVELHGSMAQVVCLTCRTTEARSALQVRLEAANPTWRPGPIEGLGIAPDGDAEIDDTDGFTPVDCLACGGPLKPDVVFFGENVPRDRVDAARAMQAEADVLLVVGSSLTVFSGFRFLKYAAAAGQPIAIVNLGPTRGDPLADVLVDAQAGAVLPSVVHALAADEAQVAPQG